MALVAPGMLVHTISSGDDCHWYVMPAPMVDVGNDRTDVNEVQPESTVARTLPVTGVPAHWLDHL